ncbi:MAG: hypothetical protein D6790_01375, partial [Caldilineae bacterium]
AAGDHAIEIQYFQDGGSHTFELFWLAPGRGQELLPPDRLSPAGAVWDAPPQPRPATGHRTEPSTEPAAFTAGALPWRTP